MLTMIETGRPFLSVAETAALLGVSRSTTYRLLRDGRIPSIRVGGQLRIPRRTLAIRLAETRAGWPLPERVR